MRRLTDEERARFPIDKLEKLDAFTNAELGDDGVFKCLKCAALRIRTNCGNCNAPGDRVIAGIELTKNGFYCLECKHVFAGWECECGCNNPARPSFHRLKKKGGCIVVTAACGDAGAPEVRMLTRFRDEVLATTATGRTAIRGYQVLAPPVVSVMNALPASKRLVRHLAVRPAMCAIRWLGLYPTDPTDESR